MPVVERDLTNFTLPAFPFPPKSGSSLTHFTLVSSPNATYNHFTWTLSFPLANTYRILLTGPNRPQPPQDNVTLGYKAHPFKLVSLDIKRHTAVFAFPKSGRVDFDGAERRSRELRLDWSDQLVLSIWEGATESKSFSRLFGDVPVRSYALTEQGIMRHYNIDRSRLHLGLGERAAPLDLTGRSFQMHGTDAAMYDTYENDPLYKHTPFLISTPRGGGHRSSTYAIYHPTNSFAVWDVNRLADVPSTDFMTFTQDYGGLEEWVMVGKGVKEIVRTFAEIVGKPRLVGRDWLGYLGKSGCIWCVKMLMKSRFDHVSR